MSEDLAPIQESTWFVALLLILRITLKMTFTLWKGLNASKRIQGLGGIKCYC